MQDCRIDTHVNSSYETLVKYLDPNARSRIDELQPFVRYVFALYALDVPRLEVRGELTGPNIKAALAGHVLAKASLTGHIFPQSGIVNLTGHSRV